MLPSCHFERENKKKNITQSWAMQNCGQILHVFGVVENVYKVGRNNSKNNNNFKLYKIIHRQLPTYFC